MSNRKFKLFYITDYRGRAEVARLIFAAAKCPYEYETVDMFTWPARKPSTKCGALPEIHIDGKPFAESLAINTFLAKEFGFYGSTALENLAIEEVQHYRENVVILEGECFYVEKDPVAKEKKTQELVDDTYPRMLTYFTNIIKANGKGFAFGDKLTLADFVIYEGVNTMNLKFPEMLKDYPEIVKLKEKVANVDGIKEYLASAKLREL